MAKLVKCYDGYNKQCDLHVIICSQYTLRLFNYKIIIGVFQIPSPDYRSLKMDNTFVEL